MNQPAVSREIGRGSIGLSRDPKLTPGIMGICDGFSPGEAELSGAAKINAMRNCAEEVADYLARVEEHMSIKILTYINSFRMPTRMQLGRLWNHYPVISLGENHIETKRNAEVVAEVVRSYGRPGDIVAIESFHAEQKQVDLFLKGGDLRLEEARNLLFVPVLKACKERNSRLIFIGDGVGNDDVFYEHLIDEAGSLQDKRLMLLTGKGHGLWHHVHSKPKFIRMVAEEVGASKVTTVFLQSTHYDKKSDYMSFQIIPHDDSRAYPGKSFNLSTYQLDPVFVPASRPKSPFRYIKFAFYSEAVSKATDYIGLT